MRFLAARGPEATDGDRAVTVHGVAYDDGVSWRRGAADGPGAIREASDSIETYSPRTGKDLEDAGLVDVGDIDLQGATGAAMVARVADETAGHARRSRLVVTLGGDHSVSMGTSEGLRRVHPDLACIVFDAHLDMRAEYEGEPYSHACGTRRMATAGPAIALGIRSGSREEFHDADRLLAGWSESLELNDGMRQAVAGRPVFVSVDLDVMDPSVFPGTGNPEPGGCSFADLREALIRLEGLKIVGIDFVECAPGLDPSEVSPIVAAKLARDGVLSLLRGSSGDL